MPSKCIYSLIRVLGGTRGTSIGPQARSDYQSPILA